MLIQERDVAAKTLRHETSRGDVNIAIVKIALSLSLKICCMDQGLKIPGRRLLIDWCWSTTVPPDNLADPCLNSRAATGHSG